MEQTKKNLKLTSALILLFAGLTLLQTIASLIFSVDVSLLPAGTTEETVLIAKIVIAVLSLLVLTPEIYVGVRGLQLAKNPAPAKAPVVWATILLVLLVLSFVSSVVAIIRGENVGESIATLLSLLVDILLFIDYIRCVKTLNKAK